MRIPRVPWAAQPACTARFCRASAPGGSAGLQQGLSRDKCPFPDQSPHAYEAWGAEQASTSALPSRNGHAADRPGLLRVRTRGQGLWQPGGACIQGPSRRQRATSGKPLYTVVGGRTLRRWKPLDRPPAPARTHTGTLRPRLARHFGVAEITGKTKFYRLFSLSPPLTPCVSKTRGARAARASSLEKDPVFDTLG